MVSSFQVECDVVKSVFFADFAEGVRCPMSNDVMYLSPVRMVLEYCSNDRDGSELRTIGEDGI